MLAKLFFNIGQRLRNPSLTGWSTFLRTSQTYAIKKLEIYQLKRLQELVEVAYKHSVYYKSSFDAIGVKPQDISLLNDLKKLPILSKEELIKNNAAIHTNLKFRKTFQCSTSGTSGQSLQFKREEKADSFNRASIFRGYSWYNVKPWEKNGYFWGFNFTGFSKYKTRLLDVLQNRFRLFSFKSMELDRFNKKLQKSIFLHGYSSMIYEVAKYRNKLGLQIPQNLKMVKGTSEKIIDTYQKDVQQAFGVKIISEYGAAETGIIAFECPSGNMHLNMEGVIVEEIDNEIIVTNLQMHAFPIIRYRLGDYIKLAPKVEKCKCGMQHPILEEVTGRVGELVYGKEETYPSLYFYYIFKNLAKKEVFLTYQVQQNIKGELLFLIEQTLSGAIIQLLQQEIERYFDQDMNCIIKDRQNIISHNKKLKSFISTIN